MVSARAAQARQQWTHPDELRYVVQAGPSTLNPLLTKDAVEENHMSLVFDLLLASDARGNFVPDLAAVVPSERNGGISNDGLTLTYRLRHNVRWHDGAPFTSKDVAFSYRAIMNPRNAVASRHGFDVVRSVETPDPYTVVFTLKRRYAPALSELFGESDQPIHIAPEHLLARYSDVNSIDFNAHPIGTGPFKFVRWKRSDSITYEANDDYFLGKPKLRRIIVREAPDVTTEANLLRTHEADLGYVDAASYAQLRADPTLDHQLQPINGYVSYLFNVRRSVVADPRVRRAIAYGIDRPSLVSKNTFGTGTLATADLPDFLWAANPRVAQYPFNSAKARALLDAAGWHVGPDGTRRKGGERMTIELGEMQGSVTERSEDVQVQAALHDLGIDVEIKPYVFNLVYLPAAQGGIVPSGKFDLFWANWISGQDPDNSSQFTCENVPPKGSNYARFCDPAFDALERVQLAHYDRKTRAAAFARIESKLANDLPQLWLYWIRIRWINNPDLHGFEPNCCSPLWGAYRWSI